MTPDQADIEDVVRSVWNSLFDLPLDRSGAQGTPDPDALNGRVRIDGAWAGALDVECSWELALELAGQMMREAGSPSADDVCDGLGEIANMVAGNVKALLPQPARISLPEVTAGGTPADGGATAPVVTVPFSSGGRRLVVRLLERR